jgi:1-deoxy-D-xylulose-5-phosphate synthase
MTLPDRFIDQGSPAQMYDWAGLTAKDIAATVRQAIGRSVVQRPGLRLV